MSKEYNIRDREDLKKFVAEHKGPGQSEQLTIQEETNCYKKIWSR